MKPLILVSTLLLAAFGPSTEACRQKYIEWNKTWKCGGNVDTLNSECFTIMQRMRDYSNSHSRLWGGDFTHDTPVACGTCNPNGQVTCTCTVRAWRFREWMYDPGTQYWPTMPRGWGVVDPDQVPNGWVDTGHKNIDCD
ncbi:hypothetical protein Ptr902_07044 [Pyrenophora tritici-repentis]|uniref:Uncharacterized protein n=1 Tax=Pyrenophora tritici-repentis TaxID=45151 RepID=A0A5M9KVV7_9PLEO|nr:hypothetical protein PtrV1_13129 [Pyrenophora tritici-repentis]KAF7446905.1 hypothetical protein A1F99_083520 [Pyrenophora tritici-repentis]KAF7569186.1 hypothetical protein PtrM4_116010 [Pyrenophora tritici-repentis]KAI0569414.1 hypothetical protein Alg130_11658 [Pyrenophora tritici-repentis]KAI0569445.1 hypothetical protein Alg215_11634 [Pyrenophora tritici-repentis]